MNGRFPGRTVRKQRLIHNPQESGQHWLTPLRHRHNQPGFLPRQKYLCSIAFSLPIHFRRSCKGFPVCPFQLSVLFPGQCSITFHFLMPLLLRKTVNVTYPSQTLLVPTIPALLDYLFAQEGKEQKSDGKSHLKMIEPGQ